MSYPDRGMGFRGTVSRILSAPPKRTERIIHLGSLTRNSGSSPNRGAGRSPSFLFGLAPGGVFRARAIARTAVVSYTTFSPLPGCCQPGGLFSVALSVSTLWNVPPTCTPTAARLHGAAPFGVRTFLLHKWKRFSVPLKPL